MATTASAARSFVLLLSWLAVSAAQKPSGWNTLNGKSRFTLNTLVTVFFCYLSSTTDQKYNYICY